MFISKGQCSCFYNELLLLVPTKDLFLGLIGAWRPWLLLCFLIAFSVKIISTSEYSVDEAAILFSVWVKFWEPSLVRYFLVYAKLGFISNDLCLVLLFISERQEKYFVYKSRCAFS